MSLSDDAQKVMARFEFTGQFKAGDALAYRAWKYVCTDANLTSQELVSDGLVTMVRLGDLELTKRGAALLRLMRLRGKERDDIASESRSGS